MDGRNPTRRDGRPHTSSGGAYQSQHPAVQQSTSQPRREDTMSARLTRQRRARAEELRFTDADQQRWAANRTRVEAERRRTGATQVPVKKVASLHLGTRRDHRDIVDIVPTFQKDGRLSPDSEAALKGMIDSSRDYVLSLTGHSSSSPIPNQKTYTKHDVATNIVSGGFNTSGAIEHACQIITSKGSQVVGLVSGHCHGKSRSLAMMKQGALKAGVLLDDEYTFATPKSITVGETREAALKLVVKLNKLRRERR